jgi:hypothetical protein
VVLRAKTNRLADLLRTFPGSELCLRTPGRVRFTKSLVNHWVEKDAMRPLTQNVRAHCEIILQEEAKWR